MDKTDEFKKSDYVIIRNLIDANEASNLYDYTLKNIKNGNLKDDQVPQTPSFYQDKKMVVLHKKLLPQVEYLLKKTLLPTFCYYRTYRTGAILRAHKDRKACEISISLNLGQQGDLWDLWLLDHNENAINITLAPGDALLYRGCKLTHWRGKLVNADFVSQVFFFFIDPKGWGRLWVTTELIKKFFKRCRSLFGVVSY
ncbi:MAG TPA: hypothetical protein VLI69_03000 [Gammaproteobacteria bacterium]|nr:hypothetical protein [Gammaproteobacteria bacterium]